MTTTQTFTWAPDFQSLGEYAPNVKPATFGDGYEQRVQFGINANPSKWTLYFTNRIQMEAAAILGFLGQMNAVQAFLWTPPGEAIAKRFVCRKWNKMPTHGQGTQSNGAAALVWTINATFEEVFEP